MAKDYGIGQQIEEQQIDVYVPEYDVTVKASPAASANVVNNLAMMKASGGQKGYNTVGGWNGTSLGDALKSYAERKYEGDSSAWAATKGAVEGFAKGVARFPMDISAQLYDLYTSGSNYMSEAMYKSDVKSKKDRIVELQARIKSFEGLDEERRVKATNYYNEEIAKLQDELKNLESDNFKRYLLETQKERKKASDAYAEGIDKLVGLPKNEVASGFESIVTSLLMAPAGTVGLATAYGTAGAGDLLVEMKERGVDSDEAMRWSTIGGGLIGVANTIGDRFILTKAVENITAKSGLMALVRGAFSGGVGEFVEEGAESLSTDVVKEIAGINDKDAGQVVSDAIVSGIMGFVGGFVFGAGSSGLELKWKKEEKAKNIDKFKEAGLSQETSEKIAQKIYDAQDIDSIKEDIANLITEDIDPSKYKDADMQKDIEETVSIIPEMMNRFLMQNEIEIPKTEAQVDENGVTNPMPEEKESYTISGVEVTKENMPALHNLLYQAEASGEPITNIAEALQKIDQVSGYSKKQKLREQFARIEGDIQRKLQRRYGEAYGRSVGKVVAANVYAGAKMQGITPEEYYQRVFPQINQSLKGVSDLTIDDNIPYQDVAQRINEIDAEEQAKGVPEYTAPTININGVERQTTNSDGNPIAKSEKSLRYFYNWFGDSRVVDGQGRPLVVWHGSPKENGDFEVFDYERIRHSASGAGFNFSEKNEGMYGVARPFYIRITNPASLEQVTITREQLENTIKEFNKAGGENLFFLEGYGNPYNEYEKTLKSTVDTIMQYAESDAEILDSLRSNVEGNVRNVFESFVKNTGKDGFINKERGIYVALTNNQIKSTSNRGTYSLTDNNIYYQMYGEKANLTPEQRSSLDKAKEMKKNRFLDEQIRRETGWKYGKDGMWRLEVSDKDAKIKSESLKPVDKILNYEEKIGSLESEVKEFEKELNNNKDEYPEGFIEKKIQERQKKIEKYETKKNEIAGGNVFTLGDILEHKNLYNAYPEVKNLRVEIVDQEVLGNAIGSYISPYQETWARPAGGNLIRVSRNIVQNKSELRKTLLHEIQHWIQHKEGFATGGSTETIGDIISKIADKLNNSVEMNEYEDAANEYYVLTDVLEVFKVSKNPEKVLDTYSHLKNGSIFVPKKTNKDARKAYIDEQYDIWWNEISSKYDGIMKHKFDELIRDGEEKEVRKSANAAKQRMNRLIKKANFGVAKTFEELSRQYENGDISARDLYNRLYGEMEARLVESRSNLSEKEIRETQLKYDVDEDDAIVVFDNGSTVVSSRFVDIGNKTKYTKSEYDLKQLMKTFPPRGELRLMFDKEKGYWFAADSMELVHSDILPQAFKMGLYPEFRTEYDARQYFDDKTYADDGSLVRFVAFGYENNNYMDRIDQMADDYSRAYIIDNGDGNGVVLFARYESDLDDANISYLGENAKLYDVVNKRFLDNKKLYQDEANPRGAYSSNERMIYLFEHADRSTFLHEMAHAWFDVVFSNTTEQGKAMQKAINEFIGHKEGEAYTREQLEKFAQGFEIYCSEGKAPNNFLKNAFKNFKNWLISIWKSVKQPDVEMNDEIREVYREMLGGADVDAIFDDKSDLQDIEDMVNKIERLQEKQQQERNKLVEDTAEAVAEAIEEGAKMRSYMGHMRDKTKKNTKALEKFFSYALTPISTRAGKIDPAFQLRVRKYMMDEQNFINKYAGMIKPLVDAYNGMDNKDMARFDIYMKNGYVSGINSLAEKYGFEKEYVEYRKAMDEIYQMASDVGIKMNHLEAYAPRRIKDKEGLLQYIQSSNASLIAQMNEEIGAGASLDEKAEWLDEHLGKFAMSDPMKTKPSNAKTRSIEVITPELDKFYTKTVDAIAMYIDNMAQAINLRKMWGATSETMETNLGLDKSIGEVIAHLYEEGRISSTEEEKEVREILDSLLGNHGRVSELMSVIKNGAYMSMLTRGSQTISQLADIGTSMYRNGVIRTLEAMLGGDIDINDVGVEKLTEEFRTKEGVQKWLEKMLNWTGFSALDVWGKNTYLRSRYKKLTEQANKNPEALKAKLEWAWEGETDALIQDLQSGEFTERVQLLMFSELSDVQPTTRAEMPAGYLNNPNGRVVYMLKTFAIRRMDMILNDTVRLWKEDRKQALSNLVFISLWMGGAEALVSVLRDFIKGKKIDMSDAGIEALMGLLMINRYQVYKAKEEGFSGFVATLVPPMFPMLSAFVEDMWKMIEKGMNPKDMRTWSYIPLIGDAYYWWIGGGYEKNKRKK